MLHLLSHLGAALAFYLVLQNNPKIKKYVDAVLTFIGLVAELSFYGLKLNLKKIFKKK